MNLGSAITNLPAKLLRDAKSHRLAQGAVRLDPTSFVRELCVLLNAGMNVVQACQALAQEARVADQRSKANVLSGISNQLDQGATFSQAIADSDSMPALLVACARAGESTGNLAITLDRYMIYRDRVASLRSQVVATGLYPLVVFALGILVVAFIVVFLMPRFAGVYENLRVDLPLGSQVLYLTGKFTREYWVVLLGTICALGILLRGVFRDIETRRSLVARFMALPILRSRWLAYELSVFYRTLSVLVKSGLTLPESLRLCQPIVNDVTGHKIRESNDAIASGVSIASAFDRSGLTTPATLGILKSGESGGNLFDVFEPIASYYDESVNDSMMRFGKVLEPIALILVAVFVGGTVLLMYLPMFDLIGAVQ